MQFVFHVFFRFFGRYARRYFPAHDEKSGIRISRYVGIYGGEARFPLYQAVVKAGGISVGKQIGNEVAYIEFVAYALVRMEGFVYGVGGEVFTVRKKPSLFFIGWTTAATLNDFSAPQAQVSTTFTLTEAPSERGVYTTVIPRRTDSGKEFLAKTASCVIEWRVLFRKSYRLF